MQMHVLLFVVGLQYYCIYMVVNYNIIIQVLLACFYYHMRLVGHKYLQFTQQFREVHHSLRINKIKGIMDIPKSNQHFERTFPVYPIQQTWHYKNMPLHSYTWPVSPPPKALLINFNALNAHTGLSGRLAESLSHAGIITTGFDYPNFGKSHSPLPGHIESMHELVELSEQFVVQSTKKYPGVPVYLNGLSMGGLVAFQVGLRKPTLVSGCILLNPAFRDNPVNNGFLKKIVMLGGMLLPKFQTIKPMRSHSTKHSLSKYKQHDKLMYSGKVWTSTTWALLSNMRRVAKQQKFTEFQLPFLCIQGGSDKILDPFTVFQLQDRSKSKDKQIVIIPDLWHALWFDDHHDQVTQMIKNWIVDRVDISNSNKIQKQNVNSEQNLIKNSHQEVIGRHVKNADRQIDKQPHFNISHQAHRNEK